MADESIILAVELDTKKALTQFDLLAQSIEDAKKRQDELNQQFKEGAITTEEYNKATKENTKEIKAAETATKNLTTAITAEKGSISALSAENKELIKQRNAISTSTQEGRDKIAQLNNKINENNELIKQNVSGLEQQRLNVGNYRKSLEGISVSLQSVVPGLGGMTNGLSGITAGAKAFTATPFGATLQVIAGLLTVLIEAFKGSEEGQRNLNKVTQVTTALFGALGDLVRQLGGFLIDAFKNPKQSLIDLSEFLKNNLINRFKAFGVILEGIINLDFKKTTNGVLQLGSGVENTIEKIQNVGKAVTDVANKALEQGNKVAQLQAEIEDLEDEANLRRAQNDLKVAKLRERSIKEEGETRKKTIDEAIALEQQSADFSIKIAQKKFELAQFELAIATDKKAAQDKLEEAEVNLTRAQTERYQATLKFQKESERFNEQAIKDREKQIEFLNTIKKQEEKDAEDMDAFFKQLSDDADKRLDLAIQTGLKELEIERENNAEFEKQNKAHQFQLTQDAEAAKKQQLIDDEKYRQLTLKGIAEGLNSARQLFNENTIAYKTATLAQALMDTYASVARALKEYPFPLNGVVAGLNLAAGLKAVNEIKKTFKGGDISTSSSLSLSTSGSGVTATRATTNPMNERFNLANSNQSISIVASWQEATTVRNRVEFKEALTTV